MGYEQILYETSGGVATLTLNRPDRLNAWTQTMDSEVRGALRAAQADDSVRAIILTGAGRGFCAGADMEELSALAKPGAPQPQVGAEADDGAPASPRRDFRHRYTYFPSVDKPILAAINGPAAGLGFILPLFCDLRFASDRAAFTTAFSRRGLIAEHGISWMLPRLVGVAHSLDLLFSARKIDAAEALRIGLVNAVFPHEDLMDRTRDYAAELASLVSPRSLRVIKRQVYDALFMDLASATDAANEEMFKSFACEDFKEGVAHFVQKRAPAFTGR
jgi:enoyl-CoA hydratase/carnithine racemase